jgi:hypothetical protein
MTSESSEVRNSWLCSCVISNQGKQNNIDAMPLFLSEGFFGFGITESGFDLSTCSSKDEIKARILANYPAEALPSKLPVDQYWKIAKEAKVGDRVFLTSYKGIIYACGEIVDGYKFSDLSESSIKSSKRASFRHTIGIKWKVKDSLFPYKEWLPVDFGIPDVRSERYKNWNTRTADSIERILRSASRQNLILTGPPGTGKTYYSTRHAVDACLSPDDPFYEELSKMPEGADDSVMWYYREKHKELRDKGRIETVTFHQNYDYSDFIHGIRPKMNSEGGLSYSLVRGPLWRMANRAMLALERGEEVEYALVIDEINRGNVAKIFGELITLVEVDKRDRPNGSGLRIPLLYGSAKADEGEEPVCNEYAGGKFCLPPNLHILGTMNSADKSVQRMDSALRRRFDFIDMPPRPEVLADNPKLEKFLEVLNRRLTKAKPGSGCLLGHAWLIQDGVALPFSHTKLLCAAFNNKVFPLLSEWFWNEPGQLKRLFGGADKYVDLGSATIRQLNDKLIDPMVFGCAENFVNSFVLESDDDAE